MAITRGQREVAWAHIVQHVIELHPNCEIVGALKRDGYTSLDLITLVSEEILMTLEYDVPATEDKPATSVRVPTYQSSLLVAFLDYIDHVQTVDNTFNLYDSLSL
jgi:hypothetical protein